MALFVLILLAVLSGAGAAGAAPVMLKDSAVVEGDVIRLGDLFDNVGAKAEIPIGYAPPAGRQALYDAAWLADLARTHGLEWRPASRFDRVTIVRRSQVVGKAEILAAVKVALATAHAVDKAEVELDDREFGLHLAPGAPSEVSIRDLRFDERSGRFSATAQSTDGEASVGVSGRVVRLAEIPVATRVIGRGEVIAATDIKWRRIPASRVGPDLATRADQIVGKTPRGGLAADEPVRLAELRAPVLVPKGTLVNLVYETAAMRLTVRGQAMDEGGAGQIIRVVNTHSTIVVEGEVTAAGTVRVHGLAQGQRAGD